MLRQATFIQSRRDVAAFLKFCERLTAETDIYKCCVYTLHRIEHGKRIATWAADISSKGDMHNIHDYADDPLNALYNALYRHVYSRIVEIEKQAG